MKPIYRWVVHRLADRVLARHHPQVVAIAGSIGKTATKEAIAAALGAAKRVRKTEGNFNAEIGVPVTIIAGGKARRGLGWLLVPFVGLKTWLGGGTYPEVLVLELGTDKPGDLEPLLKLVQPKIGVLTAIAPEHLEFFGDLDSVAQEEASVLTVLGQSGIGVVNADDKLALAQAEKTQLRSIKFGWSDASEVQAVHMEVTHDGHGRPIGQTIKVAIDGSTVPIAQPGIIGRHQAYPFLAALSVCQALGVPIIDGVNGLKQYLPPPGRMRLLEGVNGATIIDDSYNASPHAMQAALEALTELEVPGQRYIILGQMSELGTSSATWHAWVGEQVNQQGCDQLLTVGPLADRIGQAAAEHGFPADRIQNVPNAEAAAAEIRAKLGPNDVVLLKGSRFAARLEQAVRLLLAHPERDEHLLVSSH